jgi:hypothetical protein
LREIAEGHITKYNIDENEITEESEEEIIEETPPQPSA